MPRRAVRISGEASAGVDERLSMATRYWDDLSEGEQLDCRTFALSLPEKIEFAEKYDPQPFHINEIGRDAHEEMYE